MLAKTLLKLNLIGNLDVSYMEHNNIAYGYINSPSTFYMSSSAVVTSLDGRVEERVDDNRSRSVLLLSNLRLSRFRHLWLSSLIFLADFNLRSFDVTSRFCVSDFFFWKNSLHFCSSCCSFGERRSSSSTRICGTRAIPSEWLLYTVISRSLCFCPRYNVQCALKFQQVAENVNNVRVGCLNLWNSVWTSVKFKTSLNNPREYKSDKGSLPILWKLPF